MKSYNEKIITSFRNDKIPKEGFQCLSQSVILNNSVYREDKNYYPEVFEDETLLQSFSLPSSILFWHSKSSKSKSSSGSSYNSKQSTVESQLLAEQEHVKTERKLQRLRTV